jgi:GAF domain-containing protein
LNDLTWLATSICGTLISKISLLDEDRQWFKSKIGLKIRQTPRVESFCAHAIMSSELFVVPDTSQDPRFAANPMVAGEPQIRFYAGAPLIAPNRHILGALCVLGQLPRQLSLDQSESLRILSKQVMAQVILGMNLQDLKAALRARRRFGA